MKHPTPVPIEGESLPAFNAFKSYVADEKRSIRRCAYRLHKACTTIARFSKKFHWQRRLLELTAQAAEEENERQRQADLEAKRKFAEQIEREKLAFVRRQIEASEKATAKALEILAQPHRDCRPPDAARLLSVAYQIGGGTLNLPGAVHPFDGMQPTARPVVNLVVQRDSQSLKAQKIYFDYFREHPEHPQSARYIKEWSDECEARGLPLDWTPDNGPPQLDSAQRQDGE